MKWQCKGQFWGVGKIFQENHRNRRKLKEPRPCSLERLIGSVGLGRATMVCLKERK